MDGLSRESWYEEYMSMMDEEYGDYGFTDDPIRIEEVLLEELDEEAKERPWKRSASGIDYDPYEECNVPAEVVRLKDIHVPEGIKKLKRDIRMETLRRLEQAARTYTDFKNLGIWYDYLDNLEQDRIGRHEILRNGDDFPIEYGESEDGSVFPAYMSDVISRQMRKGDFLDAIYLRPDTIDELVTTDYMIHFMRALDKDERELFYFKVLENLSSSEIAGMRGQTDRAVRKAWNNLLFHLRQRTMGVLIFRDNYDYSFTGDEQRFLDNCREEYEFRLDDEAGS